MARTPGKRAEADGDVRARLLGSAAELFSAKGYAGTTVREIVERAGVTKPALYYYFRSKEGIYLDLMRAPLQGFTERIESTAREKGTFRERITRLCLRAYDDFVRNLPHARILFPSITVLRRAPRTSTSTRCSCGSRRSWPAC